jgi:signal transduction histidine kinase
MQIADAGFGLREPGISWSSLRLLPAPVWIPLFGVLIAMLAVAAMEARAVSGSWTRAGLLVMTLLSLGLLFIVTRQFIIEAVRQESRRAAAEEETKELEKLVDARTRELSALSTHLQEFSEKEKSELARNLHDELGGLLTAAKMDLSWLQSRLDAPMMQERLVQLGTVLDEAMDLKRRVVEDLRPSLLDHFGLPTALRAYLDSACAKAGLQSEISIVDEAESMPKDAAIALFRIVQEGLTNIIRHAQARRVRLILTCDGQRYAFTLSDDGRGFDSQNPQFRWSHGLMGMRQRVRALSGRFAIESSVGGGTTLRIEVPKTAA